MFEFDVQLAMDMFECAFMMCLMVLTIFGTAVLCVRLLGKANAKKKEEKKETTTVNVCFVSNKAKKNIRNMLKKEYGLIPLANQPKKTEETEKEVEA